MSKVLKIHCTDFNALNAMYVGDVGDGVSAFMHTVCRVQISCQRRQRYSALCIQWPLAMPGGKACCSCTVRPVGLVVHHHAVRGGSFVFKCSGTCQTTRVIAGKMHSQSPILKVYGGTQQPGNSYKAMTKLHPPHSNRTCHKQFRI